jgi:hypothetical protein
MIDRPHFPLPQRRRQAPARAAPPPPPRSARTPLPPSSPQRRPSLRRWTVPSAAAAPVLRRRRGEWRRGPRCRGHDAASLSVVEASLGIRRRRHRCRDDGVCDLGPGRALLLLHPCSCRRRGAWRWRPTKPWTRRGVTPSLWERRVDTTAAAAAEATMSATLGRLCCCCTRAHTGGVGRGAAADDDLRRHGVTRASEITGPAPDKPASNMVIHSDGRHVIGKNKGSPQCASQCSHVEGRHWRAQPTGGSRSSPYAKTGQVAMGVISLDVRRVARGG